MLIPFLKSKAVASLFFSPFHNRLYFLPVQHHVLSQNTNRPQTSRRFTAENTFEKSTLSPRGLSYAFHHSPNYASYESNFNIRTLFPESSPFFVGLMTSGSATSRTSERKFFSPSYSRLPSAIKTPSSNETHLRSSSNKKFELKLQNYKMGRKSKNPKIKILRFGSATSELTARTLTTASDVLENYGNILESSDLRQPMTQRNQYKIKKFPLHKRLHSHGVPFPDVESRFSDVYSPSLFSTDRDTKIPNPEGQQLI